MLAPIALQLYTVREALAKDFNGVIKHIADLGYVGVETAGVFGGSPASAAKLFADLGLTVCSAHGALPLGDKKQEVIDMLGALNCKRLVLAWQPPALFKTVESIQRVCDSLNEANAVAQANGFTLGYHNHWFEYELLDGRPAADIMAEYLDPSVFLEVDVYWVRTGGQDPVEVVRRLGPRASLLHIKDGPGSVEAPMVAVGAGTLDVPGVVAASAGSAQWLIVELDRCATDMLEAVEKSYGYLIGKGLARGNKN
jgi:sugar phosphate isomerase/epimerase